MRQILRSAIIRVTEAEQPWSGTATANKIYEPYKFTFFKLFMPLFINIPKAETVLNLALNMHAEKGEIMQLPTYQE